MRIGLVALGVAFGPLIGCTGEDKDGTDAPPVQQGEDEPVVCEGANPELTELWVGDHGEIVVIEGEDAVAIEIAATGQDDDSDLHIMGMILWWDDVVDGAVDTSGAGEDFGYLSMGQDSEECTVAGGTYSVLYETDGGTFEYETEYEFAAQIYDAAGLLSEIVIASGTSPAPL